ncbi:ferredoxin--nitrite reductase [Candidatus Sulfurimonas baltica]|uniref:Ferredoxin--nitrite reductase n=1 Tax=Candidatus Sulfurimonas baltica TaxID=2740404 RepID=A0A7S7LUB2_9BACT|nr:ferredoxin--nitrite reductase [Candidatus Sulfurimonas baltica]QOY50988.1 ferredoxin--nitrite reductase [Candidatus Sulfurimonas baltica]
MKKLHEAYQERSKKINKIEQLKELNTPKAVYDNLQAICAAGYENLKDEDSKYFLKCFGLFDKNDGTFMIRVRIAGGQLSIEKALVIGEISKEYGNDYIDITTRQQIELRYIKFENLHKVLTKLDAVGITTFQTGIDNFRNIVTSSFDGLSSDSFVECMPIIEELQGVFLHKEEWTGVLPRKFNAAILGSATNDCNIFGHDCCFIAAKKDEELGFNLYLGGRVGMQAEDINLFIKPEEVKEVFLAVISLFKEFGFRDNRNKNRLHFLIEAVGMDVFRDAIIQVSKATLQSGGELLLSNEHKINQDGCVELLDDKSAVLFSIPSGIFCGSDLIYSAECTKEAEGELRLSIEQSFYMVCKNEKIEQIKATPIYKKYEKYQNPYFVHQIACAGTATCSFGVIPNKPDAVEMAEFLHKEVPLTNAKVRMYWSACPKGCGIHGIADIGFEGCKAKDEDGNTCYGVHILLGGKASYEAKESRVIYKSIPLIEAKYIVKKIMLMYKNERQSAESFEIYESRVLSMLNNDEVIKKIENYH